MWFCLFSRENKQNPSFRTHIFMLSYYFIIKMIIVRDLEHLRESIIWYFLTFNMSKHLLSVRASVLICSNVKKYQIIESRRSRWIPDITIRIENSKHWILLVLPRKQAKSHVLAMELWFCLFPKRNRLNPKFESSIFT
jgi:hypothetical protein